MENGTLKCYSANASEKKEAFKRYSASARLKSQSNKALTL